jgi:RNA polymerase sigma-70 factor (ECF subfamily)
MPCPVDTLDVDTRMRQVLATHRLPLTRFVLGLTLGHRQTAEDLVQETMLRAWRNLDTLPPEDEASRRWLFTVARNLVIDHARKRQARPVEVAPLDAERVMTGDVTAGAALANHALREAVANLSTAHREVLHEVYFEDRPVPDVAARLGIPVGTVRSRVHYAIRSLREAVIG